MVVPYDYYKAQFNMLLSDTYTPFQSLIKPLFINGNGRYTFNWRDKSYSADAGGFRPVEAMFKVSEDGLKVEVEYLTEFRFVGTGHYAELAKATDFDFQSGRMVGDSLAGSFYGSTNSEEAKEFLDFYLKNLCSYIECGFLDEFETEFEPS